MKNANFYTLVITGFPFFLVLSFFTALISYGVNKNTSPELELFYSIVGLATFLIISKLQSRKPKKPQP